MGTLFKPGGQIMPLPLLLAPGFKKLSTVTTPLILIAFASAKVGLLIKLSVVLITNEKGIEKLS